jgi:hypothetical protein
MAIDPSGEKITIASEEYAVLLRSAETLWQLWDCKHSAACEDCVHAITETIGQLELVRGAHD